METAEREKTKAIRKGRKEDTRRDKAVRRRDIKKSERALKTRDNGVKWRQ